MSWLLSLFGCRPTSTHIAACRKDQQGYAVCRRSRNEWGGLPQTPREPPQDGKRARWTAADAPRAAPRQKTNEVDHRRRLATTGERLNNAQGNGT
jgi:hypothetical protein